MTHFARLKRGAIRSAIRGRAALKGIDTKRLERFEQYLDIRLGLQSRASDQPLQRPFALFPGLTARPWHEPSAFEWVEDLEASWEVIRDELVQVRERDRFDPFQGRSLVAAGEWTTYYLRHSGHRFDRNCAHCAETARAIESIPEAQNAGVVYFSALSAGSHIAAHCGPTNTRLRCHLGIDVPDGARIRVGSETRTWTEGRCLILDDSFEHEVWNEGERSRTVLIVDFWHPDLTDEEVWALTEAKRISRQAVRHRRAVRRAMAAPQR